MLVPTATDKDLVENVYGEAVMFVVVVVTMTKEDFTMEKVVTRSMAVQ